MAFCKNCGVPIADGTTVCPNCAPQPEVVYANNGGAQFNNAQYNPQYNPQYNNPQYNGGYAPQGFAANGSTWDGGVFDTFVNSLVASLIMSITCGIATPWAVCYMMKFIISHAVVDGKRLSFDGTGAQLFGNWIKWWFFTVITCGIYSFWVAPRMYKWVCSHIHSIG